MVEHTVLVDMIGGTIVLSSETLQIRNIEYSYPELTKEGIIDTLTNYKYFSKEDIENMGIIVVDNRPKEEENYNEVKNRESQEFKRDRNSLKVEK